MLGEVDQVGTSLDSATQVVLGFWYTKSQQIIRKLERMTHDTLPPQGPPRFVSCRFVSRQSGTMQTLRLVFHPFAGAVEATYWKCGGPQHHEKRVVCTLGRSRWRVYHIASDASTRSRPSVNQTRQWKQQMYLILGVFIPLPGWVSMRLLSIS